MTCTTDRVVMTAAQLHDLARSGLGRDLIRRRARLQIRELAGRYPYRVHPGPAWFVRDHDSVLAFTLSEVRVGEATGDAFSLYTYGDPSAVYIARPGAARYAVTVPTSGELAQLRKWIRDTTDGREVPRS